MSYDSKTATGQAVEYPIRKEWDRDEQYKGRVLDAISDSVAQLRRGAAQEDQTVLDQLSGVAQEFSTLTFGGPGKLSSEAYHQRLNELAQQQEKLEAELSSRSAALRQVLTPITLEAVRQALPADAVLVEWFRRADHTPCDCIW